ncbi:hypothetical protein LPB86_14290 [Pedobacter sp. MC2016-14]|uniref:hypothetical protein n=1 Tax=Pedobacter sp. MC2016-14 TaxID=2897327 RepID=UPI001E3F1EA9|nr:hypothetical protein [Pedobacter sp. MC2016-14]MCD0489408.1 hypothetical protein [Pedobacter sp. MC2016-14]
MANTIPFIFPKDGASLGVQKTTIPIVFQNRGVVANGFVQLAPKKSEFFTTPPQQFDSQDWLNNLAVHELRHAAQFDKLTRGRPYPFPEEIYYAVMGASIPLWFFEGDAVSTETSLTNAGRGKQPSWIMPYRTTLLNNKNISYTKAQFGSQKDVTPGYYQLGYLMVSALRNEFGKGIADSLLSDIRDRPVRLYPFSNSLKKFTGRGSRAWYLHTTAEIKKAWQQQDEENFSINYTKLHKPATYATDYFLPVRLPSGEILALKQSKAETAHFVLIDSTKKERNLFGISYQEQPWFSYANGILVWDEIRYDPRFRQRSYSVICSYNFDNRSFRKLSTKSRIFSPSLSADGKKIVAVQVDLSNNSRLIELETETGKIIRSYQNPENAILQTPSFDESGTTIAFVSVTEKGKSIKTINQQGKIKNLIVNSAQQLSRPIFISSNIAFNAHYSGIDNIYSIDTASKKISALSASKYGAFNPSKNSASNDILFNNYNLQGYEIAEASFKPQDTTKNNFIYFGSSAEKQEHTGNVFKAIPDSVYTSTPYGRFSHFFNFHSISPQVESDYIAGLRLKSNNLLNTIDFYAGADYHRDLGRFAYVAGLSLKSFYPILNLSYQNRPVRNFYSSAQGIRQGDWRENYYAFSVQVPVNLNALNHNYSISVSTGTSYTKRYMPQNLPSNFITELQFPISYSFSFSHTVRQAERDVAPKWGQILRLRYLYQPFDKSLPGELFSAAGFLYFPGLANNHNFLANFNYQNATGVRRYNTDINTVAGYNNVAAKSTLKNTLLFGYSFPIAFPDFEVGPLAYIRTVRAGLFCHYENIGKETNLSQPKTYGFEFRSKMNALRYDPILEVGTRFVFVNKTYNQNPIFELILNYNF